jgi:hypothetical protein
MECIKADRLLEPDDFKLTKTKKSGKRLFSVLTFRSVRTEFTSEDDLLLKNYLEKSDHPNGGFSLNAGTTVYKDIAKAHPNHPWQSWRNRGLKTILHLNNNGQKKNVHFSPEMDDEIEDDNLNNIILQETSKQDFSISPKISLAIMESNDRSDDVQQPVVKKSKPVDKGKGSVVQSSPSSKFDNYFRDAF